MATDVSAVKPFAFDGVDFGYVRVVGNAFFLRTSLILENEKYGDLSRFPKIFYRWRLVDKQLIRDEQPYFAKRGSFFAIPPVLR